MTKYLSDFERYGFKADEIIPFLAAHGIHIGEVAIGDAVPNIAVFPEWKQTMSLNPFLTHTEAASAFANIDMNVPYWLSENENIALSEWEGVLVRSIAVEELQAEEMGGNQQGNIKWRIKPSDLIAWCEMKGIPYPLPNRQIYPRTDTGLRDALSASETERARLKAEVVALKTVGDQRAEMQAEINRLRSEQRVSEEKLAAIASERDRLKADALDGKARTTALTIIGGLVASTYGSDIHALRIAKLGEMVADIERAGARVDEKTLRKYIKDASEVIDKPNGKT